MRSVALITILSLLAAALAVPAASAHEHYASDDGRVSIVLGEQDEPVYTYDWTNLDLIVRDNETGVPISGVDETVNATLIAPGGEELSLPIEPQHGADGRYEFVQDYYLTQPGQYEVRLEGTINGSDVTGTYDLPGPREAMNGFGFPASDVPTLLDLQDSVDDVRERQPDTSDLEQQVSDLEQRITELEAQVQTLEEQGSGTPDQQNAPGAGALLALVALAGVAGLTLRRRS